MPDELTLLAEGDYYQQILTQFDEEHRQGGGLLDVASTLELDEEGVFAAESFALIRLINLNLEDTPDNPGIEVDFDNVRLEATPNGPSPCNPADIADPRGVLDLADITTFVDAFLSGESTADLDNNGLFDLADINAFVTAFATGCP